MIDHDHLLQTVQVKFKYLQLRICIELNTRFLISNKTHFQEHHYHAIF